MESSFCLTLLVAPAKAVPHWRPVFHPSVFPFTIYVNPGFKVHLNDFFSETTASMNLKFHMQHDQTAGLQTCKSQLGRESKIPPILK